MLPTEPYKIYLDNLPNDPSFGDTSNTSIRIVDVCYNFGIPSVRTFQIDLSRNFHNLHSQYGFLRHNREILNIDSNSTGNTSWVIIDDNAESGNSLSVKLKPIGSEISFNESGYYDLSHTDFSNIQGYYTSSITVSNGDIGWTETLQNLKGNDVSNILLTHNHYCDYGSFIRSNGQNGQINQPSLNLVSPLHNVTICEISNINLLGENLGGIIAREYTDHTTVIQDHTLLYIDGKFQTNAMKPYPDTRDFSWNGYSSIQDFSAGTISYDIDGSMSETNEGYKWIVLKIPSNSSSYVKIAPSKIQGGGSLPYIDVPKLISDSHFNSSSNNDIKAKISTGFGAQDVIGFIRIINKDNITCIGRFTNNKVPNSLWYLGGNSSSVSLSEMLANTGTGQAYGTKLDQSFHVHNSWGVECPNQSNFKSDSFIEIFIGIKNSVAL